MYILYQLHIIWSLVLHSDLIPTAELVILVMYLGYSPLGKVAVMFSGCPYDRPRLER